MSTEFSSLVLKADSSDFVRAKKDLQSFETQSEKTEKASLSLGKTFVGLATAAGGLYTLRRISSGLVDITKSGSDLNETLSKSSIVLGSAFSDVEKWANGAASSLGQTKKQALDAASTFGIFAKSAGLSGKDLGDFSIKFSSLASDFASFYNTSPEDAIVAIGAAFRGETEPIRRYGILLDDMSLRQAALAQGIVSTTKNALTPQQRVLAAGALIMKKSTDAQGDFARTSDQAANKQRKFTAEIENSKAAIGTELLPVMNELLDLGLKIAESPITDIIAKLAKGIGIEMQLLSGKSISFIKTTNTIAEAMKIGGDSGRNMLLDRIAELNSELFDTKGQLQSISGINLAGQGSLLNASAVAASETKIKDLTEQIDSLYASLRGSPKKAGVQGDSGADEKAAKAAEEREKRKIQAEKLLNDQKEDAVRLTKEMYTPLEALAAKEKELDVLIGKKLITEEVYNRAKKEYTDAFKESVQSEIDSLTSGLLTQEQMIAQSYERRNSAILESDLLLQEKKDELLQLSKIAHEKEVAEYIALEEKKKEDARKKREDEALEIEQKKIDTLNSYETLFSGIASAQAAFGAEQTAFYKAMFIVSKGFALAESIMAIQVGLAKSASIGFPQNLLTIGPYIAQTAGIIASISSVKFKDKGGFVGPGETAIVGEIGPEIITGPAQVTSRNKTAQILKESSESSGKQVNVYVTLKDSNFIGNNAALRDMGIKIGEVVNAELTRKGAV